MKERKERPIHTCCRCRAMATAALLLLLWGLARCSVGKDFGSREGTAIGLRDAASSSSSSSSVVSSSVVSSSSSSSAVQDEDDIPAFYIHEIDGWDYSKVHDCWKSTSHSSSVESTAEISILRLLEKHRRRVTDAASATLFIVPFLPFLNSEVKSSCLDGTAESRADAFFMKLRRNKHFVKRKGLDHVMMSNHWDLEHFLGKMGAEVCKKCAIGVYEDNDHTSELGSCRFVLPYVENKHCYAQPAAMPFGARKFDFMFHGSFGVGCGDRAGLSLRTRRGFGAIHPDAHTVNADFVDTSNSSVMKGDTRVVAIDAVKRTAKSMLTSKFCLVMKGDTLTTSRLFDAMACHCLPVIVSLHPKINWVSDLLPFGFDVNYTEFVTFVDQLDFDSDSPKVLKQIAETPLSELKSKLQAMDRARKQVLLDLEGTHVADTILLQGQTCALHGHKAKKIPGFCWSTEGSGHGCWMYETLNRQPGARFPSPWLERGNISCCAKDDLRKQESLKLAQAAAAAQGCGCPEDGYCRYAWGWENWQSR